MSGLKKTVIFLISFFSALIFMSILSIIIGPIVLTYNQAIITNIIYPIYFSLGFIFFTLTQSFIRYIQSKKVLRRSTILFTTKISRYNLNQRSWFYAIILLIFLASFFKGISFNYLTIIRILLAILALILVEMLLRFSNNTMKIYFLKEGFLITGFDIRVELPMLYGFQIYNDSGFYSYNDIDSYIPFPDHVELYLILERGTINADANGELARQISGILAQNKIEMRKF